jgi:hypothetical protein
LPGWDGAELPLGDGDCVIDLIGEKALALAS